MIDDKFTAFRIFVNDKTPLIIKQNKTINILVIRLSSMGDVALTIPVLQTLLFAHPNLKITVLTKKQFAPIFYLIPNIEIIVPDFKKEYKGLFGLFRLYQGLKATREVDMIIDLHDTIRSRFLSFCFRLHRIPIFRIDKGRANKRKYTQKNHPPIQELRHTTQRYADVFRKAKFKINLSKYKKPLFKVNANIEAILQDKETPFIGIAPFAAHDTKQLPLDKMKKIIAQLIFQYPNSSIFIFGGGQKEKQLTAKLTKQFKKVYSLVGQFDLIEELVLMQQMEVMLTMDSSNLHLARLIGTPVVSIWGSTHPYLGFSPFKQFDNNLNIQISTKELPCRPCSVYGNQPCHRGDFACMNLINENDVVQKIEEVISL